jgi:hypothetical protein
MDQDLLDKINETISQEAFCKPNTRSTNKESYVTERVAGDFGD